MNFNLNLGISIVLPINPSFEIPEYSSDSIVNNKDNPLRFNGLNSLQIMFSKTNLSGKDVSNIKNLIEKIKFKFVYIHASYQINIGSEPILTKDTLYSPSQDIFLTEIKNSIKVGANGIIVHMGKNVKNQYEPDDIYNNMVNFVVQLFNNIKKNKILSNAKKFQILFETPAGQGGEMCSDIGEMVNFIQTFKTMNFYKNIGLCIDTCHIFQAGHNLNDLTEIKRIHKILEPIKDKICAIHLNDSKHSLGSHLDRHEQIGKGKIITNNLIKFILPYINIPLILETIPPYENQIKLLTQK